MNRNREVPIPRLVLLVSPTPFHQVPSCWPGVGSSDGEQCFTKLKGLCINLVTWIAMRHAVLNYFPQTSMSSSSPFSLEIINIYQVHAGSSGKSCE